MIDQLFQKALLKELSRDMPAAVFGLGHQGRVFQRTPDCRSRERANLPTKRLENYGCGEINRQLPRRVSFESVGKSEVLSREGDVRCFKQHVLFQLP